MGRGLAVLSVVVLGLAGCAPALGELKPALSATDAGGVWFATAGSLVRSTDRSRLVPDVYGALRVLVTHPRIDGRRVALMGFSHGGILTLGAATVWAQETFAPAGYPAFRAFLPFYPSCNTAYPERERISAPLRIHAGELDDWTPAAPCVRLVEQLSASGQDATITVYPGAHHSFDNIGRSFVRLTYVDSGAACMLRAASILGPLVSRGDSAACVRKGATIAWNPEATERARRNVRAQLSDLLR